MGLLITPPGRDALRRYRYVGSDHSLLYRYVLSPWAEWCVAHLVPRTMAPNAITLLGLGCQAAAFATLAYYVPTMTETPPRWAAGAAGAALFVYSTLDNMDGKQARRTGSSSPLGLLFDHGCDAVNAGMLGSINMTLAVGCSAGGWRHLVPWLLAVVPFILNTWEEYWTLEFHLPIINGPNEGLLMLVSAFLLTAWHGTAFWALPMAGPLLGPVGAALSPALRAVAWVAGEAPAAVPTHLDALFAVCSVMLACTAAWNVRNVARATLGRRGGGVADFAVALWQLAPFVAVVAAAGAWLHTPAVKAAVTAHPFCWYFALGAAFVEMASALMVAHACEQAYAPRWAGIALFALPPLLHRGAAWIPGPLAGVLGATDALLWAACAWNLGSMAGYMAGAVHEICETLDIDVFSIDKQLARNAAATSRAGSSTAVSDSAKPATPGGVAGGKKAGASAAAAPTPRSVRRRA